jgi:hypothetical protein
MFTFCRRKVTIEKSSAALNELIILNFYNPYVNCRYPANKMQCSRILTLTVHLLLFPSYFTNHCHFPYDFRKSLSTLLSLIPELDR